MIFVVFAAANWSENSIQSKHLSPSNPNYSDIQPGSPAFHGGRGSELLKVELVGIWFRLQFTTANSLDRPGDVVMFLDKFQHSTLFAGNVACGRDRGTELR